MKKHLFVTLILFLFWNMMQAQVLVNGDFDTYTCNGNNGNNAFDPSNDCAPPWYEGNGSPSLATSTATGNGYAWMWSAGMEGESIIQDYNFERGQCYNVSFRVRTADRNSGDPNVAASSINLVAASGITPNTNTQFPAADPATIESIFNAPVGSYYGQNFTNISLTYEATFDNDQLWIFPFMTQPSNNSQAEFAIDDIVITPAVGVSSFHLEDNDGNIQSTFICGEEIILDGTASQGESQYKIHLYQRPPGSFNFQWIDATPWMFGQVGLENLSAHFGTLAAGFEYQARLAISNYPCIPWTMSLQNFTVVKGGKYKTGFQISAQSDFGGNVTVSVQANQNAIWVNHHLDVFYAGLNGETTGNTEVPGNPVITNSSSATFSNNLVVNQWYYVKHGIWNDCINWRERRRAFRVYIKLKKNGEKEYVVEYKKGVEITPEETMTPNTKKGLRVDSLIDEERNVEITANPNPFHANTMISFSLDEEAKVDLTIFDLSGNKIKQLVNSNLPQGVHEFKLEASGLPSGVYLVRLVHGNKIKSSRVVLTE